MIRMRMGGERILFFTNHLYARHICQIDDINTCCQAIDAIFTGRQLQSADCFACKVRQAAGERSGQIDINHPADRTDANISVNLRVCYRIIFYDTLYFYGLVLPYVLNDVFAVGNTWVE